MKIAVTSDIHLTSSGTRPERLETLSGLFHEAAGSGISHIILAGDTFDASMSNYKDLDRLCSRPEFKAMQFMLIPGNHDAGISQAGFSSPNIRIFSQPEIMSPDLMSLPLLFVPYRSGSTMGDVLAEFREQLQPSGWILIGHGDWSDGLKTGNPLEPGIYMPLSRSDIDLYQPCCVILGHIHKPMDAGVLHYPGSPCPLDINETGRRRALILDSERGTVEPLPLRSLVLYFQARIVVVPGPDEWQRVESDIGQIRDGWSVQDHEKDSAVIRLHITGYTSDKSRLARLIGESFRDFKTVGDEGFDLSRVLVADDPGRSDLFMQAMRELEKMQFSSGEYDPEPDEALFHALQAIYEVR
ncbi:metallophosphoesterase [bacterium]|nr:metallophosphoesterase [bacterium]